MVPAMLLQPLVENAYVHGLSKLNEYGLIEITAKSVNDNLSIAVRNRGIGLHQSDPCEERRSGIGLSNVRSRLRLHYGDQGRLEIRELASDLVEAVVVFPISFAASSECTAPQQAEPKVLYQT